MTDHKNYGSVERILRSTRLMNINITVKKEINWSSLDYLWCLNSKLFPQPFKFHHCTVCSYWKENIPYDIINIKHQEVIFQIREKLLKLKAFASSENDLALNFVNDNNKFDYVEYQFICNKIQFIIGSYFNQILIISEFNDFKK